MIFNLRTRLIKLLENESKKKTHNWGAFLDALYISHKKFMKNYKLLKYE